MASSVSPLTGSNASPAPASSTQNNTNSLSTPSEGVFLNLLVAQIKNQDPLNPTDSTQFVSQLAQFSELEQVIALRNDADTIVSNMNAAASANSTGTNTGTPGPGQTPTGTTTPTNNTSQP